MSSRPSPAAQRRARPVHNTSRIRPMLVELEARNQPTRLGLSVDVMPPAPTSAPLVANFGVNQGDGIGLPPTANEHAVANALNRLANDTPGVTVTVGFSASSAVVVEVFSVSSVEIQVSTNPPPTAVKDSPPPTMSNQGDQGSETPVVRRPGVVSDTTESSTNSTAASTTARPQTATPVTLQTTTPTSITQAALAAANGTAVTPTTPASQAVPARAVTTTPLAFAPQQATLITGQSAGGGGGAPYLSTLTTDQRPPDGADRTGGPTGTPAADANPATQGLPAVEGELPAEAAKQPKAEQKADDSPWISTRLPAIIASVAVTMYGFWYWWRRSARPGSGNALRLFRRGSAKV